MIILTKSRIRKTFTTRVTLVMYFCYKHVDFCYMYVLSYTKCDILTFLTKLKLW